MKNKIIKKLEIILGEIENIRQQVSVKGTIENYEIKSHLRLIEAKIEVIDKAIKLSYYYNGNQTNLFFILGIFISAISLALSLKKYEEALALFLCMLIGFVITKIIRRGNIQKANKKVIEFLKQNGLNKEEIKSAINDYGGIELK